MKYDKQYHVLSAIYRMTRVNVWPIETAARLLHERAKYKPAMARAIAEIWFNGPFKHTHKRRVTMTAERAAEIQEKASQWPYWGNTTKFMTPDEEHEIRQYWINEMPGTACFNDALTRVRQGTI